MLAAATTWSCRPAAPASRPPSIVPSSPATTTPPPTTTAVPDAPAADPAPAVHERRSPPVHLEVGWIDDVDDPAAPVLHLTSLVHHGGSARAFVDHVLADVGPLLACATAAAGDARGQVSFQVRVRGSASTDSDPLEIDVHPDETEEEALAKCIEATVRPRVEEVAAGDLAYLSFRRFPDRDAVFLRPADDARIVAVRAAGTCWQWETYPCAPHKHCMAPEFVRTSCGDPTMRDDVSLVFALGPADERGRAGPTELVLRDGAGATLWATPLPESTRTRYGSRFAVADAPIVLRPGGNVLALQMEVDRLVVADTAGLHAWRRRTGELVGEWLAPARAEPTMQFDGGQVRVHRRSRTCTGDAGHGTFFISCDDREVWFDGHTLAIFGDGQTRPLSTKTLGTAGMKLRGETLTPTLSAATGGVSVEISGQIFVQ